MNYGSSEKKRLENLISTAKITKSTAWYKKAILPKVLANKHQYKAVADKIGCPMAFIVLTHLRENGSDIGKFKAYLGNGQPLNKKTTLVPKGRGPFASWSDGAIDALKHDGVDKITGWDLPKMLYMLERYNGFGYRNKGINTPYVWSFTNHYIKGKYVADGKFSSTAVDSQIGCYAFYLDLIEAEADFKVGATEKLVVPQPELEAPKETPSWVLAIKTFLEGIWSLLVGNTTKQEPKAVDGPDKVVIKKTLSEGSGPRISREEVVRILEAKGANPEKEVCLLGVRGYYLDSMGVKGKNDRGIYDDALIWCFPDGFMTYKANTDPSRVRKGKGTGSGKGMANLKTGHWKYKTGMHNGSVPHPAFRQAAAVTVVRDGSPDYEDTGWFGINIHRGGYSGTSSLGCQTVPRESWDSFKALGYEKLKQYDQKTFSYVLVVEEERR